MKIAANLTFMFQEAGGLLQRYEAAAAAGFKYVECANPYAEELEKLASCKERFDLHQVLINTPPGKTDEGGGFGMACLPDKKAEFRESIAEAVCYAKRLRCQQIHVLAGKVSNDVLRIQAEEAYQENIKFAAAQMEKEGITCTIEPINLYTIPGYFLFSYDQALGYIQKLKCPNLKLQMDIFHMQQICGTLTRNITRLLPFTSHIQIAQVPDRHEPDTAGEISYEYVFKLLKDQQFDGYIGCEYRPSRTTLQGLGWVQQYGLSLAE